MWGWQRGNMLGDYSAVSSKMKNNYSKLHDITAVPQDVRRYATQLTGKPFAKARLQIPTDTVCSPFKKPSSARPGWEVETLTESCWRKEMRKREKNNILFNISRVY